MEQIISLGEQLAAYKADFKQRAAPDRVAMMEAATAKLRATGIELQALQVGTVAPDMPLPATYVIDRDGRITYAHIEADYRERAEPAVVMAAVAAAQETSFI